MDNKRWGTNRTPQSNKPSEPEHQPAPSEPNMEGITYKKLNTFSTLTTIAQQIKRASDVEGSRSGQIQAKNLFKSSPVRPKGEEKNAAQTPQFNYAKQQEGITANAMKTEGYSKPSLKLNEASISQLNKLPPSSQELGSSQDDRMPPAFGQPVMTSINQKIKDNQQAMDSIQQQLQQRPTMPATQLKPMMPSAPLGTMPSLSNGQQPPRPDGLSPQQLLAKKSKTEQVSKQQYWKMTLIMLDIIIDYMMKNGKTLQPQAVQHEGVDINFVAIADRMPKTPVNIMGTDEDGKHGFRINKDSTGKKQKKSVQPKFCHRLWENMKKPMKDSFTMDYEFFSDLKVDMSKQGFILQALQMFRKRLSVYSKHVPLLQFVQKDYTTEARQFVEAELRTHRLIEHFCRVCQAFEPNANTGRSRPNFAQIGSDLEGALQIKDNITPEEELQMQATCQQQFSDFYTLGELRNVMNVIMNHVAGLHREQQAAALNAKDQSELKWTNVEVAQVLVGVLKLGEKDWEEVKKRIDFSSSQVVKTADQIAFKWRQIKRVMHRDLKKLARQPGAKIISRQEWILQTLKTMADADPKEIKIGAQEIQILRNSLQTNPNAKTTPFLIKKEQITLQQAKLFNGRAARRGLKKKAINTGKTYSSQPSVGTSGHPPGAGNMVISLNKDTMKVQEPTSHHSSGLIKFQKTNDNQWHLHSNDERPQPSQVQPKDDVAEKIKKREIKQASKVQSPPKEIKKKDLFKTGPRMEGDKASFGKAPSLGSAVAAQISEGLSKATGKEDLHKIFQDQKIADAINKGAKEASQSDKNNTAERENSSSGQNIQVIIQGVKVEKTIYVVEQGASQNVNLQFINYNKDDGSKEKKQESPVPGQPSDQASTSKFGRAPSSNIPHANSASDLRDSRSQQQAKQETSSMSGLTHNKSLPNLNQYGVKKERNFGLLLQNPQSQIQAPSFGESPNDPDQALGGDRSFNKRPEPNFMTKQRSDVGPEGSFIKGVGSLSRVTSQQFTSSAQRPHQPRQLQPAKQTFSQASSIHTPVAPRPEARASETTSSMPPRPMSRPPIKSAKQLLLHRIQQQKKKMSQQAVEPTNQPPAPK